MGSTAGAAYEQTSLDELDEPLRATTFTVVDLETTGGSAAADGITEIGAVRVRGGAVSAEFQTLVDPGMPISPFVSMLTGITNAMVGDAPGTAPVLASFLEFARGSVLVAHNAPFDVGFLRAGCDAHGLAWPGFAVVDTAVLARRILTRDEVPNCKLATLAAFFHATTSPSHRALADARATVDVLHALLGRLGSLGVQSLPELRTFTAQVTPAQRRKRHLADGLPDAPGVYIFRDAQGTPLYVGTSRRLRSRVRQYFVASETRSRMGEMVGLAERVDPVVCAHPLEAQVRELRLIAAHKPRYNKRSKFPERCVWLRLTDEAYPRLSIVGRPPGGDVPSLGPLRSRRHAESVRDAIHDAVPLRQCTDRLSAARRVRSACALAGIGRCQAPCEHAVTVADYATLAALVTRAWTGDVRPLIEPMRRRLTELSVAQRYEQAAALRDRITAVVRACARTQRLRGLTAIDELVAAVPVEQGWELAVIRSGRLAAAGMLERGRSARPVAPVVDALLATAEVPVADDAVLAEEAECVLRWLEQPGARLVRASQPWAMPAHGAGGAAAGLAALANCPAPDSYPPADERLLRPVSRPARGFPAVSAAPATMLRP